MTVVGDYPKYVKVTFRYRIFTNTALSIFTPPLIHPSIHPYPNHVENFPSPRAALDEDKSFSRFLKENDGLGFLHILLPFFSLFLLGEAFS